MSAVFFRTSSGKWEAGAPIDALRRNIDWAIAWVERSKRDISACDPVLRTVMGREYDARAVEIVSMAIDSVDAARLDGRKR